MAGILRTGLNFAHNVILPSRTAGWKTKALNLFLHFTLANDQGKGEAALATLCLQGRLSWDLFPAAKVLYSKTFVKQAQANPVYTLMWAERKSLIKKVVASVSFYATKDVSLRGTLSKLISHSPKVSKVAEPILNRPPAYVIALAPVALKLTHIALIYVHSMQAEGALKNMLETAKWVADTTSQALESLWHLRFSLSCLATSPTMGKSFIFSVGYPYCASWLDGKIDLASGHPLGAVVFDAILPSLLVRLVGCDSHSTWGVIRSWQNMQAAWNSPSVTQRSDRLKEYLQRSTATATEL